MLKLRACMGTEDMLRLRACMGTEDMLKLRACMGAAVNLGKDLRMSIRLTSGGDLKSVLDGRARAGQALLGCLLMSSFQVSSLLGAMG